MVNIWLEINIKVFLNTFLSYGAERTIDSICWYDLVWANVINFSECSVAFQIGRISQFTQDNLVKFMNFLELPMKWTIMLQILKHMGWRISSSCFNSFLFACGNLTSIVIFSSLYRFFLIGFCNPNCCDFFMSSSMFSQWKMIELSVGQNLSWYVLSFFVWHSFRFTFVHTAKLKMSSSEWLLPLSNGLCSHNVIYQFRKCC